jgi:hypothetical protein
MPSLFRVWFFLCAASGAAVASFDLPQDLPVTTGLVLRLESDSGIVLSGDRFQSWTDLSPRGNHVLAWGAPVVMPDATPSGQRAIQLDGLDDRLERVHASHPLNGFPTGSGNRTLFVVAAYETSPTTGGVIYGAPTANRMFGLGVKSPGGELVLVAHSSPNNHLASTAIGAGAGWLVQSGLLHGGVLSLFRNGDLLVSGKANLNTTLTRLVIGQDLAQAGFVPAQVAAVLLYDRALTAMERAEVELYLKRKYIDDRGNTAPVVTILEPPDDAHFVAGDPVTLRAWVSDVQESDLAASVTWDSDVNAFLGRGASLTTRDLAIGPHLITASVVDAGGLTGVDSVALTIRRANRSPAVTILTPVTDTVVENGAAVVFTAAAFDEEDGDLSASVSWSSSRDGFLGTGAGITTTALSAGLHLVTARVTDGGGASASATVSVTVQPPPNLPPSLLIDEPADGMRYRLGEQVVLRASAHDPEEGDLSASITWVSDRQGGLGTGSPLVIDGLSVGAHIITARVVDSGGATASAEVEIHLDEIVNQSPLVTIIAPVEDAEYLTGESVNLVATVTDAEDDDETLEAAVQWSSDRDGTLASGAVGEVILSEGVHRISASVTDSHGSTATTSVNVTVVSGQALPIEGLVLHLDAAVGLSSPAGVVTSWSDQSPLGNDVFGWGEPRSEAGITPAGGTAIRLSASDGLQRQHLTHPLLGFPEGNVDRSMFVVVRYHRATNLAGVSYGAAGANQSFGIGVDASSGNLALHSLDGTASGVSNAAGIGAGWLVQGASLRDGVVELYRDDELLESKAHTFATQLTEFAMGRSLDGQGGADFDVVAVLLYDRALTERERSRVVAYLRDRLTRADDSDGDGLPDPWELIHFGHLDRTGDGDFDQDGLSDRSEFERGLNPTRADSDHDGMPDGWEERYQLNPYVDDAGSDADADGVSNRDEYRLGRNPRAGVLPGQAAELQLRVFQPFN